MLSFVLAGMACVFAALCYAEFASMVPVAGSAYTYAYATLGELFAWIIGWDLILEYAVGSATVAHGWSAHFQEFTPLFNFKVPAVIHTAPVNYCVNVGAGCPHTGFVATGSWFDLPAILITFALTIILIKGIQESATFNAFMVAVKLVIVLMVIVTALAAIDFRRIRPIAGWLLLPYLAWLLFASVLNGAIVALNPS